jgi:type I restriction enzyme, S subunit
MELKAGYKQTEVGVIPEDWNCTPIADIARLESGHTPSKREPRYWGGKVPWVSLHDTDSLDGSEISITAQTITEEGLSNSSARLLPEGTVIFSRTATVGKATVMGRAMATSQDFANYICGPKLHNHFLVYLFRNMGRTWKSLMAGSIHNTIYMPVFKALKIVHPPIEEQRAIAEALSDVDGLLGGLDRLIAKKRDLKQAAMQQLLTGQTRLPGFHSGWVVKRLGHAGRCLRGVSYRGNDDLSPHDTAQTKRLLRANNVQDAEVVPSEVQFVNAARVSPHQVLDKNDILICMANGSKALVGKAALFTVNDGYKYTFGAFMSCFRTDASAANPSFVSFLFQTGQYRNYINNLLAGSSINNLKPSSIESLEFSFPEISEQTAIAAALSDIDAELAALQQRREKTRALKQAMMQELLTGKTRLITAGESHARTTSP